MIRAISLDLDDTLWPVAPSIRHAETALLTWLGTQVPHLAAHWPIERLRAHRDEIAARHPQVAHDYGAQRRLSLSELLADEPDAPALVDAAYAAFYAARNRVELYADTAASLTHLAARLPLASLSNGTADLQAIGLAHHFAHRIAARDVGAMKPDPSIFAHLCERFGLAPDRIAHVGDDPDLDVAAAQRAGLFAIWINRDGRAWPHARPPDLTVADLHELCAWVDAQPSHRSIA